jgi:hypothetical protein
MSENSENIVKCIARVWRLIKKQEELFRSLMTLEIPAHLRKTCSNGFMISLLHKKEMGNLYESVKCSLTDGELASITKTNINQDFDDTDQAKLLCQLVEEQKRLICAYEELTSNLDGYQEAALACETHAEECERIGSVLCQELLLTDKDTEPVCLDVA